MRTGQATGKITKVFLLIFIEQISFRPHSRWASPKWKLFILRNKNNKYATIKPYLFWDQRCHWLLRCVFSSPSLFFFEYFRYYTSHWVSYSFIRQKRVGGSIPCSDANSVDSACSNQSNSFCNNDCKIIIYSLQFS